MIVFIRSIFLLIVFFASTYLSAQPQPCVDPLMTPTCAEACIICDIDGFTGINDSPVPGTAPPGFCTFGVQNIQWIAFIAGSTNLQLEVEVTNCQNNVGLQIGIYESLDCLDFTLISNCENSIPQNTTAVFNMNQPLVIGQYYYFVMDGDLGDICNYTVTVTEGSTLVAPLPSSGIISGVTNPCPGLTEEYSTTIIEGATFYDWTLDGELVGTGPNVLLDWNQIGTYELCVTASNVCDTAPISCQTITVAEIPPTLINETICEGDCLEVADTTLCDPGNYQFPYITDIGCDSLVEVDLQFYPTVQTDLTVNICEGDSLFIGGNPYFETGLFQEVLTTYLGCDSTVNLDLTLIACELMGEIESTATQCFGESSGAFSFFVTNGTPPLDYTWESLGGMLGGSGQVDDLNQPELVSNLPLGTYLVTVSDQFGNDLILITEVVEPPLLDATESFSDYNGYPVSCTGSSDGFLAVQPSGGVPPYSYSWNTAATDSILQAIGEGFYSVTISDFAGCEIVLAYQFFDPPQLEFLATATDPNCDGPNTGLIQVDTIFGGVGGFTYDLDVGPPSTVSMWTNLSPGSYTLEVTDKNGCFADTTLELATPQIPEISSDSPYMIDLGDSVDLLLYLNLIPDSVAWDINPFLSCFDCLTPSANPVDDAVYIVEVWSEQGCVRYDTLVVKVEKIREVYIPNIFSPDNDGVNDIFYIFGGKAVAEVIDFQIFDRWGAQVFLQQNFPANQPSFGWDGMIRGQPAQEGTYTWFANIRFVDEEVYLYEGSITVIR